MTDQPQLHMTWPTGRPVPPAGPLPAGYRLRQFAEADVAGYHALMRAAGFDDWQEGWLDAARQTVLPDGLFVVEHARSARLVATAMAQKNPTEQYPDGGELGWVAACPAHRGRGLGRAVTLMATARLAAEPLGQIYLKTDDFRLPALALYLSMGWQPNLYTVGMAKRWQSVREQLARRG